LISEKRDTLFLLTHWILTVHGYQSIDEVSKKTLRNYNSANMFPNRTQSPSIWVKYWQSQKMK